MQDTNLKEMIDRDIRDNTNDYPKVSGGSDPNIDFRRIKNLVPFFEKFANVKTIEVISYDVNNLSSVNKLK